MNKTNIKNNNNDQFTIMKPYWFNMLVIYIYIYIYIFYGCGRNEKEKEKLWEMQTSYLKMGKKILRFFLFCIFYIST